MLENFYVLFFYNDGHFWLYFVPSSDFEIFGKAIKRKSRVSFSLYRYARIRFALGVLKDSQILNSQDFCSSLKAIFFFAKKSFSKYMLFVSIFADFSDRNKIRL